MPRYILRPTADVKAEWTEDPVGTAYTCLDETVEYPTAPTTGSDRITVAAHAKVSAHDVADLTLGTNETVIAVRAWAYGKAVDATKFWTLAIYDGASTLASSPYTSGSFGWASVTYNGTLTQTQVNALQVRVTSAGTSTVEVDAAYIEVFTHDVTGSYSSAVLADTPKLYWKLSEAAGVTVADSSGNGNHGKLYWHNGVSGAGVTLGTAALVASGTSATINGTATVAHPAEDNAGTGLRADAYKPYTSASKRTFEVWLRKTNGNATGFQTIFSGSGGELGPHPTLEVNTSNKVRWYGKTSTFPVGYMDWGGADTEHPNCDFTQDEVHHLVLTFDDVDGVAELWIDGVSQGAQSAGYLDVASHYNTVDDPGFFQVGFRGTAPDPGNTEIWIGPMDEIAVYEYKLTSEQIAAHYLAGGGMFSSRGGSIPQLGGRRRQIRK